MDHLCVCEEEGNKAWYKKPGRFPGNIGKEIGIIYNHSMFFILCLFFYK